MKYPDFCDLKQGNNRDSLLLLTTKFFFVLRVVCLSFIFLLVIPSTSYAVDVVVNNSVPAKSYSLNDVRAIFMMRTTQWANGKIIKVFVLADNHPSHQAFTKNKLALFPHQLRSFWNRLVQSGTGKAPIEVASLAQMLKAIAVTPYAIGYIDENKTHKNIRRLNYQ
ncbi:MAG: hypothetical protein Q9M50_08810 [Methylococcales bacterium]|nr:hypothetical protein [Methylococcales bacterium]